MVADTVMNKTDSRAAALRQVAGELIVYRPLTGEFLEKQGEARVTIAGPQRRTFAELRTAGLISYVEGPDREVPMRLTETGEEVAEEWGLTSQ